MAGIQASNQRLLSGSGFLDFVSDAMIDCRRFRILCFIDDISKGCLSVVVDNSISGAHVARQLDGIAEQRGVYPLMVVSDSVLCRDTLAAQVKVNFSFRSRGENRQTSELAAQSGLAVQTKSSPSIVGPGVDYRVSIHVAGK